MQPIKDQTQLPDPLWTNTNRKENTEHCCQVPERGIPLMDRRDIVTTCASLHRDLIEWICLTDDDTCILTYLSTIADACLVTVDEQTGVYKSASVLLLWDDGYTVSIDIEGQSILAGTPTGLALRLELPYSVRIRDVIKRNYDAIRSVRELNTLTGVVSKTQILF